MDDLIERDELIFNDKIKSRVRYVGVSAKTCVECEDEIPEARRVALPGIKTCVDCAT